MAEPVSTRDNLHLAQTLIDRETTLFWFRRDLRLEDNTGLYHALNDFKTVLPVFIFDTNILDQLEDQADKRLTFIHETLQRLKSELEKCGSSLLVLYGDPQNIFNSLNPIAVFANHDYEPYARERDRGVESILTQRNIVFRTFKDQVIFEKNEVTKDDGTPYTVFTPYSRKWKEKLGLTEISCFGISNMLFHLKKTPSLPMPTLGDIGFVKVDTTFPGRVISNGMLEQYSKERNYPWKESTTRLSVHIRFGTVSIRQLVNMALEKSEDWLNELIWREFYQMILWHFPHVVSRAFKPSYDRISWRNDPEEFGRWCRGVTGYPIVDAGMRELNETGFMHNRVRMITASFLTKHLLIDWRWGEAYFARKLLDFDLAANNGGWQWAAGTGCDAAPYFRVFNPSIQTQKFDAEQVYIRKWIPEFQTSEYPLPIVEHAFARNRAIASYQQALNAQ